MNRDTGEIKFTEDILEHSDEGLSTLALTARIEAMGHVPVDNKDMTMKQRETMQVSPKDHRSKLGKQLTAIQQRKKVFGK